jgi:thioredoxin 1
MAGTDTNTIVISDDSFTEMTKKHPKIVVDCWAPWCGPCRMISPIVDELAKEYKGQITFGKLNVDENVMLTRKFHIMGIPTLLFIENGELVDTIVGVVPKDSIVDRIDEVFR